MQDPKFYPPVRSIGFIFPVLNINIYSIDSRVGSIWFQTVFFVKDLFYELFFGQILMSIYLQKLFLKIIVIKILHEENILVAVLETGLRSGLAAKESLLSFFPVLNLAENFSF